MSKTNNKILMRKQCLIQEVELDVHFGCLKVREGQQLIVKI